MAKPLADQILDNIAVASELYYRLVLVVGPAGSGKTLALQEVAEQTSAPLINVNRELSLRLLDLTKRQRALQVPRIFGDIVDQTTNTLVLLDNIELLFDVELKQDPIRLLQRLSRNRTIVVAWSGNVSGAYLTYAAPTHPEYHRYPIDDFLLVRL